MRRNEHKILVRKSEGKRHLWRLLSLQAGQPWNRGSIPGKDNGFSFHHCIQAAYEARPSYPVGTRDCFTRVTRPRHKTDHSPPPSAQVINMWSYTFTPLYIILAWCWIKHSDCTLNVVSKIILKWTTRKLDGCGLDSVGSEQGPVRSSCEHGGECIE
jgi:hypothetical protein